MSHVPLATATPDPSRLLTVPQVVEITQLAPATIYRLMQRGQLVSVKVGKSRRIPVRCLDAFVNARIDEATASLPQPSYSPLRTHASAPRRRVGNTIVDNTKARPTPAKSSRASKGSQNDDLRQLREPR